MEDGTGNGGGASEPATFGEARRPPPVRLHWASGELACDFRIPGAPYDLVEEFIQRMEEGLFEDIGIPRCLTAEDGTWLEHYDLVWEGRTLGDGERLSDLDLPLDAALTLVRSSIPSNPLLH